VFSLANGFKPNKPWPKGTLLDEKLANEMLNMLLYSRLEFFHPVMDKRAAWNGKLKSLAVSNGQAFQLP
jgi:hypothetical protein